MYQASLKVILEKNKEKALKVLDYNDNNENNDDDEGQQIKKKGSSQE